MKRIRVLLVDDDVFVRQGLRHYLEEFLDVAIAGEAGDGEEALRLAEGLAPDILLLDVEMPGLSGVEVARRLQAASAPVRVLALSAHRREEYVLALLAAGAVGYLIKGEPGETILAAVREAARGETGFFSRSVACRLADLCRDDAAQENEGLTARERELLALMTRGWDNARIAKELCLARQTVRNYSSHLYARLGVSSRAEAIVWARERGLMRD